MKNKVMLNIIHLNGMSDLPIWTKVFGADIIDFNKIIPVPEWLDSRVDEYALRMQDDWRLEHWGTKWDPNLVDYGRDFVLFETSGGVPTPIVKSLSAMDPEETVTFCYVELENPSPIFVSRYRNGHLVKDSHWWDPYMCFVRKSENDVEEDT